MAVVDVHAHYLSPDLLDRFRTGDGEHLGVSVQAGDDGRDVLYVADTPTNQAIPLGLTHEGERIAWMDGAGIDVQVVSSWMQLNGYHLAPARGRELARLQNDGTAALVRRFPGRFAGATTVPLQEPLMAIEELRRTVETLGFRAVQIGTHVNEQDLDDASLDPFWEAAAALGVLVLLHPFDPPGLARMRRHLLELLIGFPAETAHAGAAMLLGGVFERHPRLRVSLPHGGGFLPYQLGRLDQGHSVLGDRASARRRPGEALDGLYFDSILHDDGALRFLVGRVGAGRVLLGSDYPFNLGEADPVRRIQELSGLGESDRIAICGRTAEELMAQGSADPGSAASRRAVDPS